jgi:hypothetical protein
VQKGLRRRTTPAQETELGIKSTHERTGPGLCMKWKPYFTQTKYFVLFLVYFELIGYITRCSQLPLKWK